MSQSQSFIKNGQRRALSKRLKKTLAACAVSGLLVIGGLAPVVAGGETRTISLYHIHTGESLTIAYMKDGRYVPSAMKKINYLLRDWRKNKAIAIDPRTIDLVWELHEDLGSQAPVNVVCGYRSAETNSMLHRIGRKVARESQHIEGRAIDFYLPDVPTQKIRNLALVRQVGGVGYYRSSGGPTGFLHVDSGHVRHWGPGISSSQMAQIFREGQKYLGRYMIRGGSFSADTQMAYAGLASKILGISKKTEADEAAALAAAKLAEKGGDYSASSREDLADLSSDAAIPVRPVPKLRPATNVNQAQMAALGDLAQDASTTPKVKAPMASGAFSALDTNSDPGIDDNVDAEVTVGRVVPRPRLKPVDIMLMAAASIKSEPRMIRINAASAPPPSQNGKDQPSPVADSLGTMMEAAAVDDLPLPVLASAKINTKGSLIEDAYNGTARSVPVTRPMIASASGKETSWWPQLSLQGDTATRLAAKPQQAGLSKAAKAIAPALVDADQQQVASGKQDLIPLSDSMPIDGSGKGDLDPPTNSGQR